MPSDKKSDTRSSTGSKSSSTSSTKTVHVHGHWRHYDDGKKTYIQPATRHVKK